MTKFSHARLKVSGISYIDTHFITQINTCVKFILDNTCFGFHSLGNLQLPQFLYYELIVESGKKLISQ